MKDNEMQFQILCQQQSETIHKQTILISDLEEEIRVLTTQSDNLQKTCNDYKEEIDKLGLWCEHQLNLLNAKELEKVNLELQIRDLRTRVQELQTWSDHLQSVLDQHVKDLALTQEKLNEAEKNLFFRISRKIKHIFSR